MLLNHEKLQIQKIANNSFENFSNLLILRVYNKCIIMYYYIFIILLIVLLLNYEKLKIQALEYFRYSFYNDKIITIESDPTKYRY